MNKIVSRGLWTVLVTGGFMALGVGVAHADTTTEGTDGIGSGNQGLLGISLPVNITGNSISLIGSSSSSNSATETTQSAPAPSGSTSGLGGLLGGGQLLANLGIPVTVGGNSISLIGESSSQGAVVNNAATGTAGAGAATSGADGAVAGNQLGAGLAVPITVSGNAISLLGDTSSTGSSTMIGSGSGSAGEQGTTTGVDGILAGNQLIPNVGVPVTATGNAISVIGDSASLGSQTAGAPITGGLQEGETTGLEGILSGGQLLTAIGLPITLSGNAVSVIGDTNTSGTDVNVPTVPPVTPPIPTDPTDPPVPAVPGVTVAMLPTGSAGVMLADTGMGGLGLTALLAAMLLASGLIVVAVRRTSAS